VHGGGGDQRRSKPVEFGGTGIVIVIVRAVGQTPINEAIDQQARRSRRQTAPG
jgi:hypothetical protein